MKHPAEYFLKYLCSRPGAGVEEVIGIAGRMGFGLMSHDYIAELHGEVTRGMPANYSPRDRLHVPSRRFLKRMGIRGMWHPTQAVEEAVALYNSPPLSELVCALLLQGRSESEIVQILTHLHAVAVTSMAITQYRHFFWNVGLLSFEEWAIFLDQTEAHPVARVALDAMPVG